MQRGGCMAAGRPLHLVEMFEPRGSVQERADQERADGGEELPARVAGDEALLSGDIVPLQEMGDRRWSLPRAIQPAWMAARRHVDRHKRHLEDTDKGLFLTRFDGDGGYLGDHGRELLLTLP